MSDYESPRRPEGCRAVIVLSDGARVILGDGTVSRLVLRDEDGEEIPCVAPSEGIYGDPAGGGRFRIDIETDDEAAAHPEVRDTLEDLGFWDGGGGE